MVASNRLLRQAAALRRAGPGAYARGRDGRGKRLQRQAARLAAAAQPTYQAA